VNSSKQITATKIPPRRTHIDKSQSQDTEKKPSRWRAFGIWTSSIVAALIIALGGGYATYQWGLNTQIQLTRMQKRQQAFSELMGERAVLNQYLFSRYEAYIHSDFHDARGKKTGALADSLEVQEARRWMQKSEDLALEVAKIRKSLSETFGLIRSYFPLPDSIKELTHRIDHLKAIEIKRVAFQLDLEQLED